MRPPGTDTSDWFAEQVQPHESSLRAFLRRTFPSLPDIDDLVQEAYARLIRAREGGRISYAKALLFATARNLALDIIRRRRVVQMEAMADPGALPLIDERPDAADTVNKQQELALLAEAIRHLPARCRQVLTLRLLYEMSHREIAAELGISEFTVKAQYAKGLRRCAEFFEKRGIKTSRGTTEDSP